MKLKEMALLLYFYLVFKDKTMMSSEDLGRLNESGEEGMKRFLEDFDEMRKFMRGMEAKNFVPYVVLSKRDEVGLFKDVPENHITNLCEIADRLIEEDMLVDSTHLIDTELKPYFRTVEQLLRDIYGRKDLFWYSRYNLKSIFENVSESEITKFLSELPYKKLGP
jgi:hypothetical protein